MSEHSTSGMRHRMRSRRSTAHVWRVVVFVTGLFFILLGFVLVVLPGPLTIPPILLGLWIWSTEFEAAQRLVDKFQAQAVEAWEDMKRHPIRAGLITAAGLAGMVAFIVLGGFGWITDKVTGIV